jgi:hypothetical protein
MDNLSETSLIMGDTDLPRYTYEPLNGPNEIRVLELSAIKTRIGTRILHVPVSSRSFQALSYVWGKPDLVDEAIILDNLGRAVGRILLTKNLGDAIRNLRDTEGLKSKVFWIDQISINQHDELEDIHAGKTSGYLSWSSLVREGGEPWNPITGENIWEYSR